MISHNSVVFSNKLKLLAVNSVCFWFTSRFYIQASLWHHLLLTCSYRLIVWLALSF